MILTGKKAKDGLKSVFDEPWPEVKDASIFEVADIRCAVQVDGKTRFILDIPGGIIENKGKTVDLVANSLLGKKWIGEKMKGMKPVDVIVAGGGKVINFVFKKKEPRG